MTVTLPPSYLLHIDASIMIGGPISPMFSASSINTDRAKLGSAGWRYPYRRV